MTTPRVHVLSLGGTIAMTPAADGALVPALSAQDLARSLPSLADRITLSTESFRQLPGASLQLGDLAALVERAEALLADGVHGIVVTQGTDTLEETAYLLDLLWPHDQPIVLTGAMRAAQAPGADGPANLAAAVVAASEPALRGGGVVVVIDDQVHSAARVQKVRASGIGAFASPSTGPLGWVSEGTLRLLARRNDRLVAPRVTAGRLESTHVVLLPVTLGMDARVLDALGELGLGGVVVDAMGVGHVPAAVVDSLERLARTKPVVLASRTRSGRVHEDTYGFPGSEIDLLRRGLVPAGHLDGLRARLLLTVLLAGDVPRDELRGWFDRA